LQKVLPPVYVSAGEFIEPCRVLLSHTIFFLSCSLGEMIEIEGQRSWR